MYILDLRHAKKCLALMVCAMLFIIVIFKLNSKVKNAVKPISFTAPSVVLDAGHGGLDGGAVSKNGTPEADINLSITLKSQALLKLVGVDSLLTRTDKNSLDFSGDASPRANKNADLYARLKIAQSNKNCDFLSIHLNKFEQEVYYGAQVFYSENHQNSAVLAKYIQNSMVNVLDKDNLRAIKPAPDSVMLMNKITSPAVTVECGFLSNNAEEALLKTNEYQNKIALAIAAGYVNYLEVGN